MLDGLKTSTLPEAEKTKYEAIGRMNRAWVYFQLVKMYGDVQWEESVITDLNDENVYGPDRKSTRLNSSHANISYAVFCLKKNKPDIRSFLPTLVSTPPFTQHF